MAAGYLRPLLAHNWDRASLLNFRAFSIPPAYDYGSLAAPVLLVQASRQRATPGWQAGGLWKQGCGIWLARLRHASASHCALHGSLLWSCSACTPALTSSAGQRGRRSGSERAHAGGPAAAPAAGQHPLFGAPSEGVLCWL